MIDKSNNKRCLQRWL